MINITLYIIHPFIPYNASFFYLNYITKDVYRDKLFVANDLTLKKIVSLNWFHIKTYDQFAYIFSNLPSILPMGASKKN